MSAITAVDRRLTPRSIAFENSWRRIDPIQLTVIGSFVLVGMWVLGVDLYQAIVRGQWWTGTDGIFSTDQLQYLAWIHGASQHLLASNMYVLGPTPADYLQPMIAISGGLVALGVAPWLALLLWKPVALAALLIAVRAFVGRTVSGGGAQRAALALALFAGTPGMFIDMWLPFWTWGYPFALVALAAALGSILSYERARASRRLPFAAAALAALAGWLHPWQGEVLILCLIGAEATAWTLRRRAALGSLLMVVGAAALPLAYYAVLHHADPSWRLAAQADDGGMHLWRIAVWLAPLAVPAALAYRVRPRSFTDAAVRVWPLAALATFLVDEHGVGNSPLHAFLGISVPLAVLATQGVKTIRWPMGARRAVLAVLAVAALTIPVTAYQLAGTAHFVLPGRSQANFMATDEVQALDYVADQSQPGGVMADPHIGVAVPALTGRRTDDGNQYWSQPDFRQRSLVIEYLLLRWLSPRLARAFVLGSGARYLIVDCWAHTSLSRLLGPIVASSHRFGCAYVYTIRADPRSMRPPSPRD